MGDGKSHARGKESSRLLSSRRKGTNADELKKGQSFDTAQAGKVVHAQPKKNGREGGTRFRGGKDRCVNEACEFPQVRKDTLRLFGKRLLLLIV